MKGRSGMGIDISKYFLRGFVHIDIKAESPKCSRVKGCRSPMRTVSALLSVQKVTQGIKGWMNFEMGNVP
jgi:hypothetical protein